MINLATFEYERVLRDIVDASRELAGEGLVGVYLHGSAAMGCFNPDKSDLDIIVVADDSPSETRRLRFLDAIADANSRAPKKGIELSVVLRAVCNPFRYPTPYELHFSPTHLTLYRADPHEYLRRLHGVDRDLAAHFTIINEYGVALCGASVSDVFGAVPADCYLDSIVADVECAPDDAGRDPLYVTLNLCRVLAFMRDSLILSKRSGGEWGLSNLPARFLPVISEANRCYACADEMACTDEVLAFVRFAIEMINLSRK